MKKIGLFSIFSTALLSSCLKDKSYTCECTYVPNSITFPAGTPNKIEFLTVHGRFREQATDNCSFDNEGKYLSQGYSGTCILKD